MDDEFGLASGSTGVVAVGHGKLLFERASEGTRERNREKNSEGTRERWKGWRSRVKEELERRVRKRGCTSS